MPIRPLIRALIEAKTFDQAKADILDQLEKAGWVVKGRGPLVAGGLKVPYATRRDGLLRLWFKKQVVYFTKIPDLQTKHVFKNARAIFDVAAGIDIRKINPAKFPQFIDKMFPRDG